MEMKKFLSRKLRDQRGSSIFVTIVMLMFIITFYVGITEYLRVSNLYDAVITNLERASNIAVEYSMIDEARGYHISTIDSEEAKKQFNSYFKTRLGLTGDYEKVESGKTLYKVDFETFEIEPDTPRMVMRGQLIVKLQLVNDYVTTPISLPFNVVTRNVNVAD